MKSATAVAVIAASCVTLLPAFAAETKEPAPPKVRPDQPLPEQPPARPRPRPPVTPPAQQVQQTMTGCLARQVWDVQSIDMYTAQIWLTVGGASERFNFQPDRVAMIAPTGTPLTTREQAVKYDMIIRSIEAAGMAKRQITLAYEPATRNVFGITIEWGGPSC